MGDQEQGGRLSPEEYRASEGITSESEKTNRIVFLPENVLRELESTLAAQQELAADGTDRNRIKLQRLEKELPEMNKAIQAIPKIFEEILKFMKNNRSETGSSREEMWLGYGEDLKGGIKRFSEIMNPDIALEVGPEVTMFRILQLHSQLLALKERLAVHLREEGA